MNLGVTQEAAIQLRKGQALALVISFYLCS